MTPPADTEEQKARMRVLNTRAEILFAALPSIVDAGCEGWLAEIDLPTPSRCCMPNSVVERGQSLPEKRASD